MFMTMGRNWGFLILLTLLPVLAHAQRDSARVQRIGASYFSQGGFYPGLTLTYEKKLLSNNSFQLLLGAKAGIYFHYRNNTGAFIMLQSGTRFRLGRRFHFEHFLGVGYLQSFLNGGDAYYVNASGQVQKASRIGNPHFMPSISFGVSYDFRGKRNISVFARPMIYWQIPFNQISLVQYAFEVGTLWKLKK
jgi:hypothetical protein